MFNTGKKLMGHRVHEGSTTTEIIGMNLRTIEDLEMLKKFWPGKKLLRLSTRFIKTQKSQMVMDKRRKKNEVVIDYPCV